MSSSEQLCLEGGETILCAIYTRLSKEDEDKQRSESESIQNQKSLLVSYALERGWDIYHIYCDAAVKIGLSQKTLVPQGVALI